MCVVYCAVFPTGVTFVVVPMLDPTAIVKLFLMLRFTHL